MNIQHDAAGTPLMEVDVCGRKEWREFEVCAVEVRDFSVSRRMQPRVWMPRPLLRPGEIMVEEVGGRFSIVKGRTE